MVIRLWAWALCRASPKGWMSRLRSVGFSWPNSAASCRRCSNSTRRSVARSEEHTSELQSLMRISYAVFCLKKQKQKFNRQLRDITFNTTNNTNHQQTTYKYQSTINTYSRVLHM